MSAGFVYILVNRYMPNVYKIGRTERSPHVRCDEPSSCTSVPHPFDVLCYLECRDHDEVEQGCHRWMSSFRISEKREFFKGGLKGAVSYLAYHPKRLSFCVPGRGDDGLITAIEYTEPGLVLALDELRQDNPWTRDKKVPPVEETISAVIAEAESLVRGGADA